MSIFTNIRALITENPEILNDEVRDFLLENHVAITKRRYRGLEIDIHRANTYTYLYTMIRDGLWDSSVSIEDTYRELYGPARPCQYGNTPKFKDAVKGYDVCGQANICKCASDKIKQSWASRSNEAKTAQREKYKATNMTKYGVDNPAKKAEFRQKARETTLGRYGVEHAALHPDFIKKREETTLERYGSKNYLTSETGKEAIKKTNLERYGVEHVWLNKEIKAKADQTKIDRHGDVWASGRKSYTEQTGYENPFQNPEIKDKMKETNLAKRGVEFSTQCPEVKAKTAVTNLERYGVENPMQNQEIKQRLFDNNIAKYGIAQPQKLEEVKKKARETNMVKYGVEHHVQNRYSREAYEMLTDKETFSEAFAQYGAYALAEQFKVDVTTVYNYATQYGIELIKGSSGERAVASFVESLGFDLITNSRTIIPPLELDIYIPSCKIAIEYNGIYWHSSLKREDDYHRVKYEKCRDAGIRLIMINEDEWHHNADIVKSKISNILGKSPMGVGARKLTIKPVSSNQANAFFERHHLQGRTGTIIASYGAYLADDLVACMAFNKQRGTQAIELIRYATDGKTYAGIFSRLFQHSVTKEDYSEVLSFADLRYSQGDVYHQNGFELVKEIAPDYRYVVGNKTRHKSLYTKSNIAKKFDIDVEGRTERQLMEALAIPRIYDCGKLKYVWKRS